MTTQPGFEVRPMRVGAEIAGLDLAKPIGESTRKALYAAWMDHGVLLFREANPTIPQHLALSRCFGELELHPVPEIRAAEDPLLIELGGSKRGPVYVFDEKDMLVGRLPWHRDTAYTVECCKGAVLHMVEPASKRGATLVADTALAYDGLPESLRKRIEKLEYKATLRVGPVDQLRPGAFWKQVRLATPAEWPTNRPENLAHVDLKARYPSVILPAVITHPESGRKCIFPSPTYVDEFLGMPKDESDTLLDELTAHMLKADYVYAHPWKKGDLLVWDNRRMMHAADGYPPECTRRGLRTTMAGSLKVGRYWDANPDLVNVTAVAD